MSISPQLDDLLELRHQANALGMAAHHRVRSVLSGLYASVFRGQGMDFEEVREYRPGDEIRNMDWRVTARTGVPHLKVFREERERAVVLCVDLGPHMRFGTRGTFKSVQAARAAALLGWAASGNQDRVGGLLFGDAECGTCYYRPSRARQSLWRILRALTGQGMPGRQTEGTDPLRDALDHLTHAATTGALIFVIADLNRDPVELEPQLGSLRQRHEVVLMPVDDAADHVLPDMGPVVFRGPDGNLIQVDTHTEAGRRRYRETWERNRRHLERLASGLGLTLIALPTDQEIHGVLVRGLSRRARRMLAG